LHGDDLIEFGLQAGYYLGTGIVSGDGNKREFWEKFKATKEFSGDSRSLGASSPMLINLGFLSDMKHKVADSGFVNTDGLDALQGKVDGLKE